MTIQHKKKSEDIKRNKNEVAESIPIVSVVMPVYNGQMFIKRSVGSVMRQTLKNLELIVVDDASTDDTGVILDSLAQQDFRIHVIHLSENRGSSFARKTGVMQAEGSYIMFLDSDDALVTNACERAAELICKNDVDIFHFNTEVLWLSDDAEMDIEQLVEQRELEGQLAKEEPEQVQSVRDFIRPYSGRLTGERILRGCFEQGHFSQSLWNKIYKRSVCQQGFAACPDDYINMADDILAFFHIAYYAQSYMGEVGSPLYLYTFGSGMSTQNVTSYGHVKKLMDSLAVPVALRAFLEKNNRLDYFGNAYNKICKLLKDAAFWHLGILMSSASPEISGKSLDLALNSFDIWELVAKMASKFFYNPRIPFNAMAHTKLATPISKPILTIGTFYHKIANGGVERVVAYLIELWLRMGYRVVLFTDTPAVTEDYPIKGEYIRCILPNCDYNLHGEDYIARGKMLEEAIKKHEIDLMVYHAWLSPYLPWDMMVCRSLSTAFCIHVHSTIDCLRYADYGSKHYYTQMPMIYPMADGVLALNKMDTAFWQLCSRWVLQINNPLSIEMEKPFSQKYGNHVVLWVGRFSEEKQIMDALYIFERVVSKIPDATMLLVGKGDEYIEKELHQIVKERGLIDSITFAGFQKEVGPFYQQGGVFLSTSKYEGFLLTVLEAQAHGLPVVMYDLPYLSILEGDSGIITVDQRSEEAAASAIVRLFHDEQLYLRLSHEAADNAIRFASIDQEEQWRSIINRVEETEKKSHDISQVQKDAASYWFRFVHSCWDRPQIQFAHDSNAEARLQDIYSMRSWKLVERYMCFMDKTMFGRVLSKVRNLFFRKG